jgi:ABC-type transporter Mla maintaining outer membrane lipid asymmetry ATPase subunit MlaF
MFYGITPYWISDDISSQERMILGGKIIAEGTPYEFARSSNPAVQQFLEGRIDGPIKIQ